MSVFVSEINKNTELCVCVGGGLINVKKFRSYQILKNKSD